MANQDIKRGVVTNTSKDLETDEFHTSQVNYHNKTKDVDTVYPYGTAGNAPLDSLMLLFNVMGQEENQAGIPYYPQIRIKQLKPGEFLVGNFVTGSYAKFKEDGSVEVFSMKDVNVTAALNITIVAGNTIAISAPNGISITSGGTIDINGQDQEINMYGTYRLGGPGGAAIARLNDQVTCPAGVGYISSASSEHTAT